MAVQDIKVRVPAGETLPVQKPGDFIYLKFADRKIAIIEDQSRFEMEAGDKYVSPNGFRDFQVQNLDQVNPVYVIFAVGKGDYYRQIIQGEIVIDPRIKTGEGVYVSDTRADHKIMVNLDYKREPGLNAGATEEKAAFVPAGGYRGAGGGNIDGDLLYVFWDGGSHKIYAYEALNGAVKGSWPVPQTPENDLYTACKVGDSIYAAGRYLYQFGAGRTDQLTEDQRVSNFTMEGAGLFTRLAVGEDGQIYAMASDDYVYNLSTQEKLFKPGGAYDLGFEKGGSIYVFANSLPDHFREYRKVAGAWTQIREVNINGVDLYQPGAGGYHAKSGKFIVLSDNSVDNQWEIMAIEPDSYDQGEVHYGRAEEQCSRVPALLNPALLSEVRTDAAVTVEWDNGRAWVSGQVLRLILDLLGIDTSGRYLDGITAFKASADGREYNINLGGRTFAADEIADDFKRVLFPQVVEITALESLWSNRV